MQDLWQRLEHYLRQYARAALACLNPPATDAEIREVEERLGIQLPLDLAASLRIHNGQAQETGQPPHSLPFIPNEYEVGGVYRAPFGELLPLSEILARTLRWREMAPAWSDDAADYAYDGPVRRNGDWSWLIFVDGGSGDLLSLDLHPLAAGNHGQVVSILHDPAAFLVLAPSYREWFEMLVTRFELGRYSFEEEDGELEAVDRFRFKDPPPAKKPRGYGDGDILRFPS